MAKNPIKIDGCIPTHLSVNKTWNSAIEFGYMKKMSEIEKIVEISIVQKVNVQVIDFIA